MTPFLNIIGTIAGLSITNACTFYLGFEAAKNICPTCNAQVSDAFKIVLDKSNSKPK